MNRSITASVISADEPALDAISPTSITAVSAANTTSSIAAHWISSPVTCDRTCFVERMPWTTSVRPCPLCLVDDVTQPSNDTGPHLCQRVIGPRGPAKHLSEQPEARDKIFSGTVGRRRSTLSLFPGACVHLSPPACASLSAVLTMHSRSDRSSGLRRGGSVTWPGRPLVGQGAAHSASPPRPIDPAVMAPSESTDSGRPDTHVPSERRESVSSALTITWFADPDGNSRRPLRVTAVAEAAQTGYTLLGWRVSDVSPTVTWLNSSGIFHPIRPPSGRSRRGRLLTVPVARTSSLSWSPQLPRA